MQTDDSAHRERLCSAFNAGARHKFVFFWGHQRGRSGITASCFSQWYEAPFEVAGERFATAEHYMMAAKASLFGDTDARARVLQAATPGAAKAAGRSVRGFDESLWVQHRFATVVAANRHKFGQHPDLAEYLQQTGERVLVEASPVDRIWGIGLAADDPAAQDPNRWKGLNLLGFALMEARRANQS